MPPRGRSTLVRTWHGITSAAKCASGFHVWGGNVSPGPDAWRSCAACGKTQEGAYDGVRPFWHTTARARPWAGQARHDHG